MTARLMIFCSPKESIEATMLFSEIENTEGIDKEVVDSFTETYNKPDKIRQAMEPDELQMLIVCGNDKQFATEMKDRNPKLHVVRFYGHTMEGPPKLPWSTYVTLANVNARVKKKGHYHDFISEVVLPFLSKVRQSSKPKAEVLEFSARA